MCFILRLKMTHNGEASIERLYSDPLETAARHLGGQMMRGIDDAAAARAAEAQPVQLDLLESARQLGIEALALANKVQPATE